MNIYEFKSFSDIECGATAFLFPQHFYVRIFLPVQSGDFIHHVPIRRILESSG